MNFNDLRKICIIYPSLAEQKAIADFLDEKCAEIDSLVAVQEQMLDQLRAYKQSLITETVTHGLNPSAPMRDSGIPWIGKIPEHWGKHRLKSVFTSRVSGDWGNDALGNNNDKFCLRIADFDYGRLRFKKQESYTVRNYPKYSQSNLYLKNGDILIEKSGGGDKTPVGRSVIFDLDIPDALYANFMVRLRVAPFATPWFIEYYLTFLYSNGIMPIYIKQTTGLQNLDLLEMLENEIVYIPSLAEQKAIADFLDEKCAEIDELIATKQQKIETLKEYKKSIIYEYVTGKKDVADE